MSTPEILSKLTPKTSSWSMGAGGASELTWQDILLAMQGCPPEHQAFMLYVYAGDPKSRHSFFAGLFMEAMTDPAIQAWRNVRSQQKGYHRAIETLCLLAIIEWSDRYETKHRPAGRLTNQERAKFMGVSRGTWNRKYKMIYQIIVAMPAEWQSSVMRKVNKRLR
jgi:hypothetical protein